MTKVLGTAEDIVKEILTNVPETRNDDFKLLYYAFKRYKPDIDDCSFKDVMFNHYSYGLPSFETIRRVRPKLQNKYPELQAVSYVKQKRAELETEFRNYALDLNESEEVHSKHTDYLW